MTTEELEDFANKNFPSSMQIKINPFKIFFNMMILFLKEEIPPNMNNLLFALFGVNDISGKTIQQLVNDPNFNGQNLVEFIKYRDTFSMLLSDFTTNGKIRADKLQALALNELIKSNESNLTEFIENVTSYQFENNDLIGIPDGNGSYILYWYSGNTEADKLLEDNYISLGLSTVTIDMVQGLSTVLQLLSDRIDSINGNPNLQNILENGGAASSSDGNSEFQMDLENAHFSSVQKANDLRTSIDQYPSSINLDAGSSSGGSRIVMTGNAVNISQGNTSDTVNVALDTESALHYFGDYSAKFTDRSLVDKGYVDNAIADSSGGDFLPLTGTEPNKPLTGNIAVSYTNFISGYDGYEGRVEFVGDSVETFATTPNSKNSVRVSSESVTLRSNQFNNSSWSHLQLRTNLATIRTEGPNSRGLSGYDDYTANIQELDYVQKKYVDSKPSNATLQSVLENGFEYNNPNDGTFPVIANVILNPTNYATINYIKPSENIQASMVVTPDSQASLSFSKTDENNLTSTGNCISNIEGAKIESAIHGWKHEVKAFKANHDGLYIEGLLDATTENGNQGNYPFFIAQDSNGKLAKIDSAPVLLISETLTVDDASVNRIGNVAFIRLRISGTATLTPKSLYTEGADGFGWLNKITPVIASDGSIKFIKISSHPNDSAIRISKALDTDDDFDFTLTDTFVTNYMGQVIPG